MRKYATEQQRLMARISLALDPHGIPTSQAFSLLAQATIMRMNSATPTRVLSLAEQAAIVFQLLHSSDYVDGSAAETLNQLMPVLGMSEFATLLETPPADVSGIDVPELLSCVGVS